jgi:hypothetical protein
LTPPLVAPQKPAFRCLRRRLDRQHRSRCHRAQSPRRAHHGSPFSGGGIVDPYSIAIDGAGLVWVVNRGSTNTSGPYPDSSISEFNSSGTAISPSTGYQVGLNISLRIAVDGSGNV